MADLLECLIQIKALTHSIARLERLVAEAPAETQRTVAALLEGLSEAERAYARDGLGVAVEDAAGGPASPMDAFRAARQANLAVLEACSAEALGRRVEWPGRPGTSIADLVAIMLAHDTERIGEIRRCVEDARKAADGRREGDSEPSS